MRPMKRQGAPASRIPVVYEDAAIIVVDKPVGLPVIAPEGARTANLYDIVSEKLKRKNPKARAALVHRIDRETSGLVVFAKNAAVKKKLMGSWNSMVGERRYIALVEGRMEGSHGEFDSWLASAGPSRMRPARPGERGALRAITRWSLLGSGGDFSLVELKLETGRRHQIRLQFAEAGHPLAGDPRYGAASDPLGRLCLHAAGISIQSPAEGKVIHIESPCPSFAALIAQLKRAGPHSAHGKNRVLRSGDAGITIEHCEGGYGKSSSHSCTPIGGKPRGGSGAGAEIPDKRPRQPCRHGQGKLREH